MFLTGSQGKRSSRSLPAHRDTSGSLANSMAQPSSLGLIDSHAHIQGKEYSGEAEAVISRARQAGVDQIVVVGGAGDMSSNTDAIALAEASPNLYATVGMHPHDAKDVGEVEL